MRVVIQEIPPAQREAWIAGHPAVTCGALPVAPAEPWWRVLFSYLCKGV